MVVHSLRLLGTVFNTFRSQRTGREESTAAVCVQWRVCGLEEGGDGKWMGPLEEVCA